MAKRLFLDARKEIERQRETQRERERERKYEKREKERESAATGKDERYVKEHGDSTSERISKRNAWKQRIFEKDIARVNDNQTHNSMLSTDRDTNSNALGNAIFILT